MDSHNARDHNFCRIFYSLFDTFMMTLFLKHFSDILTAFFRDFEYEFITEAQLERQISCSCIFILTFDRIEPLAYAEMKLWATTKFIFFF